MSSTDAVGVPKHTAPSTGGEIRKVMKKKKTMTGEMTTMATIQTHTTQQTETEMATQATVENTKAKEFPSVSRLMDRDVQEPRRSSSRVP